MMSCTYFELSLVISLLLLIVYGLISLRNHSIQLPDVLLFSCVLMLLTAPYLLNTPYSTTPNIYNFATSLLSIEGLLAVIMVVVLQHVRSLEGMILLLLAYISQVYMIHSVDLLTFYVTLELQNFVFMVLCGLPKSRGNLGSFTVEAALKFLVLSAFSSGVLLYWFSLMYQVTGMTSLVLFSRSETGGDELSDCTKFLHSLLLLSVVMFKLGAAPVHLWVVQVYGSVERWLLFYISTAPKISLFGFWIGAFQGVWTEYSVIAFALVSTGLGALGAYSQSKIRMLLSYSTLNEIGLLLSAAETAGFTSLFQHLVVYITAQLLLWNLLDTRMFTTLAVSLAGLPPLAGFFGKAWIFWQLGTIGGYTLLTVALVFTVLSLIYYLRLVRLFYNNRSDSATRYCQPTVLTVSTPNSTQNSMIVWTSVATVLLFVLPVFLMRPFVVV